MFPILLGGGTNIGPYWSPPIPIPNPIPGVSKSLLPGGESNQTKHIFYDFHIFLSKAVINKS